MLSSLSETVDIGEETELPVCIMVDERETGTDALLVIPRLTVDNPLLS